MPGARQHVKSAVTKAVGSLWIGAIIAFAVMARQDFHGQAVLQTGKGFAMVMLLSFAAWFGAKIGALLPDIDQDSSCRMYGRRVIGATVLKVMPYVYGGSVAGLSLCFVFRNRLHPVLWAGLLACTSLVIGIAVFRWMSKMSGHRGFSHRPVAPMVFVLGFMACLFAPFMQIGAVERRELWDLSVASLPLWVSLVHGWVDHILIDGYASALVLHIVLLVAMGWIGYTAAHGLWLSIPMPTWPVLP